MPATVLLAIFALLALLAFFGITLKIKGLKVALISTGLAFIVTSLLYVGVIFIIVQSM
jgi:hypothetical protein